MFSLGFEDDAVHQIPHAIRELVENNLSFRILEALNNYLPSGLRGNASETAGADLYAGIFGREFPEFFPLVFEVSRRNFVKANLPVFQIEFHLHVCIAIVIFFIGGYQGSLQTGDDNRHGKPLLLLYLVQCPHKISS